jgi:hypothetical protein
LKLGFSRCAGVPGGSDVPLRLVASSTASSGFSVKIVVTESCQGEGMTTMLHEVLLMTFECYRHVVLQFAPWRIPRPLWPCRPFYRHQCTSMVDYLPDFLHRLAWPLTGR